MDFLPVFSDPGPLVPFGGGGGSSPDDVGQQLALGVLRGRWSLEHLDKTCSSELIANNWRAAQNLPTIPHRNLAREWIAAHPREWDALLRAELQQEITPPLTPADPIAA